MEETIFASTKERALASTNAIASLVLWDTNALTVSLRSQRLVCRKPAGLKKKPTKQLKSNITQKPCLVASASDNFDVNISCNANLNHAFCYTKL